MLLTNSYTLRFKNQNKNCFLKYVTLFLPLDGLDFSEQNCFYFLGNLNTTKHVFKR